MGSLEPVTRSTGGGSVAADTLFDAKGDLAVGTGADAASKLTVGTSGRALVADSTAASGLAYERLETYAQQMPTGAIAETYPRFVNSTSTGLLVTLRASLTLIGLRAGMVISNITFVSGTTAANTPTHQQFGIFDTSGNTWCTTADDTATAWAANTAKTLAIANVAPTAGGVLAGAGSWTVPTTGAYLVGCCVQATTVPTLMAESYNSTVLYTALSPGSGYLATAIGAFPLGTSLTIGAAGTNGSNAYAYVS